MATATSLLPAIARHPDLKVQMDGALRRLNGPSCKDCDTSKVVSRYRQLIRKREERDKP